MPVSTKKLVYDVRRKLDSLISGYSNNSNLVDIIAAINEAQEIWFENRVDLAETDSTVRNELSHREEKKYEANCNDVDKNCCVVNYPENYYRKLNESFVVTNEKCCPNYEKKIPVRVNQSDDINETISNPYRKANFAFEQINGDEGSDGFYIYHQGQMGVKKFCMDYYRKPNVLHAPSLNDCGDGFYYDYCEKTIRKDIDFEGDRFSANSITDIATLLIQKSKGNINDFQKELNYILVKDRLKK